jgi:hypothetical protein
VETEENKQRERGRKKERKKEGRKEGGMERVVKRNYIEMKRSSQGSTHHFP